MSGNRALVRFIAERSDEDLERVRIVAADDSLYAAYLLWLQDTDALQEAMKAMHERVVSHVQLSLRNAMK